MVDGSNGSNSRREVLTMRLIDADAYAYPGDLINEPTIDAVPVVRSRWVKSEFDGYVKCESCKNCYIQEEWAQPGRWNFCSHCGAHMDGGVYLD